MGPLQKQPVKAETLSKIDLRCGKVQEFEEVLVTQQIKALTMVAE